MKRLFLMLVFLFIVFFIIQFAFQYFGTGHEIEYQIKNGDHSFTVQEKLVINTKQETDHYYLEVKINDTTFFFQTYENFKKGKQIIKDIAYFKSGDQECILPIFMGKKILFDVTCQKDQTITYYHDLKGKNKELDQFVSGLKELGYNESNWIDQTKKTAVKGTVTAYPDNIRKNHFVGANSYKGLYTINQDNFDTLAEVSLFTKDYYERPLSTLVAEYYVTADYEQEFEFSKFYIVSLLYNEVKTVKTNNQLSRSSYIQGNVKKSVYIYDPENKKQYELNAKDKTLLEVGNENTGIKIYKNGKWDRKKPYELTKEEFLFKEDYKSDDFKGKGFDKVDKFGNQKSGYYYLYKKVNNQYEVYRANVQNKDQITYLFKTDKISDIYYVKDYIYFTSGNTVKYYQDGTGVRTVFQNSEFAYNKSLKYNIYVK